jgi:hypothetical protein
VQKRLFQSSLFFSKEVGIYTYAQTEFKVGTNDQADYNTDKMIYAYFAFKKIKRIKIKHPLRPLSRGYSNLKFFFCQYKITHLHA